MAKIASLLTYLSVVVCGTLSVGCPDRGKGGPCNYQEFDGMCHLGDLTVQADDGGTVTVKAGYYALPLESGFGYGAVETTVPADKEAAARLHYEANNRVPCKGAQKTTGSCSPGKVTPVVPSFVPQ